MPSPKVLRPMICLLTFGIICLKVQTMLFCGYETVDAVIKLEKEEEQMKMFEFVVSMKDVIEDPHKIFGIFVNKPEKIMILPGLKTVFEKFIELVKNHKNPKSICKKTKPKTKKINKVDTPKLKSKSLNESNSNVLILPTLQDLRDQMQSWLNKQSKKMTFNIENTENVSHFLYTCGNCKWKGHLIANSKGKVCLSNVQRHYRNDHCSKNSKKPAPCHFKPVSQFFPPLSQPTQDKTSESPSSSNFSIDLTSSESSSISQEGDPMEEGIHFHSASATASQTMKPSEKSKNLHLPAGHLGDIETSGL